jgi:uncharacterized protein (DUF1499 family)
LKTALGLSILGMLPLLGGLGTGFGLWEPMTGFRMTMNYMTLSSISAAGFLVLVLYMYSGDVVKAIKYALAIFVVFGAGYSLGVNQEAPDHTGLRGIHDVTTDMVNPPEFEALLDAPERRNSFDYPQETANRQAAKFPWVKPIMSDLDAGAAFDRAVSTANALNWDIVALNKQNGRIEGTDYSKWFNFHDDVVIRVTATESGSRVDIRSLTRVGGSDHGLGAARIMRFIRTFEVE